MNSKWEKYEFCNGLFEMKEVLEFEEKEILKCSSRFTSSIYHVRSVIQNITFQQKSMLGIYMKQILLSRWSKMRFISDL